MKTRNVIVPKSIIVRHYPHPEYYGESIVELVNGMVTDVYTNQEGYLFTPTNDEDLISYLLKQKIVEEPEVLEFGCYTLKSIDRNDAKTIYEWFMVSPFRRAQCGENDINIVYEYISHARSLNSNVYMLSKEEVKIGLMGFTIIDGVALINCDIYNHLKISFSDMFLLMNNYVNYLNRKFKLLKMFLRVSEFDGFMLSVVSDLILNFKSMKTVLIQTLTGALVQYEYELNV